MAGADGKVSLELATEMGQTLAAWRTLNSEINKTKTALETSRQGHNELGQSIDGVKTSSDAAASSQKSWFDGLLPKLTAFGGGFLTLSSAIKVVRNEYDAMIRRQEQAGNFQVSVAGAQRAALRNLGQSDLTPKQFEEMITGAQSETGADQQALYAAASGVLSARGKFSAREAIEQLQATAKLDPSFASDELQTLSGGALDIRKAFGGTPEQALGGMLASQQTSRIENAGQFGASGVPAMLSLQAYGNSFREASALFGTITQETADKMGERSGTAVIQLAKQVLTATASIKELEGASTAKRLEFLTSGKEEGETIRRALLGTLDQKAREAGVDAKGELTGEAKQYMALVGLLTPGSKTQAAYQETFAATPELGEGEKVYEANLEAQRQLGGQSAARISEFSEASTQTAKSEGREGVIGTTREGLTKLLDQLGTFGRTSFMQNLPVVGDLGSAGLFEQQIAGGQNPVTAAVRLAQSRLAVAQQSGEAQAPENAKKLQALQDYIANLQGEVPETDQVFDVKPKRAPNDFEVRNAAFEYAKKKLGAGDQAIDVAGLVAQKVREGGLAPDTESVEKAVDVAATAAGTVPRKKFKGEAEAREERAAVGSAMAEAIDRLVVTLEKMDAREGKAATDLVRAARDQTAAGRALKEGANATARDKRSMSRPAPVGAP